ncbi:MAG TPA: ShlB/FhaC/HecB family hemolysin secretion/activation protein [Chakrabartia sp.]|jgi:hemolysin activation/secretion protein|nr:ShlB/FhaC/HecB family hemolysin secretion/activation protein [Chakrabartia sp.]
MRQFAFFVAAFAGLAGSAQIAHAQVAAGVAPTREEVERRPVTPLPPSIGQRITVDKDIERAPCPLASPEFATITLTLNTVEFANLKGVDAVALRSAWSDLQGKTISLSEVCAIRDRAATILRRQGYLAAVQIPPQRIENGVVRFDVLMARIVGFQVRGNAGKAEGLISRYLAAIKEQEVFNIGEAERYLLLARDIPGYDVRMTLRPAGTVPGEVIGEVQVLYTPVEAELNLQNYGAKATGRIGGIAQVRFNGLLGSGDRTSIGFFSTADFREQQVLQLGEEIRIGDEGLVFAVDGSYAWTRPDLGPTLDLTSRTFMASAKLRYPLIRRQTRNLFLSGGLDLVNQRVRFAAIPLTEDKLRVAFVRADYDAFDAASLGSSTGYSAAEPRWRFAGSVELRHGLDLFGTSQDCGPALARCALPTVVPISRLEADPTAFVGRIQAYGEYRPTPRLAFVLNARGQYAHAPLLAYEEVSGGVFTVGRGYDPGAVSGDSGVAASGEIRLGSLVPQSAKDTALQAYAFADAAWVWNRDVFVSTPDPDRLISVGGGIRAAFGDRFVIDAGAAVPLRKTGLQAKRGDVRFLVNLTVKLLPWKR